MVTVWPGAIWVFAGGSSLVTVPCCRIEFGSCWTLTFKWAFVSAVVAAFWLWFTTFGTETLPTPADTLIVTGVLSEDTAAPFAGLVLITSPFGTDPLLCSMTW